MERQPHFLWEVRWRGCRLDTKMEGELGRTEGQQSSCGVLRHFHVKPSLHILRKKDQCEPPSWETCWHQWGRGLL